MRKCVEQWRKYYDTVAISAAIYHIIVTHSEIGRFIGIEQRLDTSKPGERLTPDLVVLYDSDRGLLFDLKYLLPTDIRSMKDKLMELSKYGRVQSSWRAGERIGSVDFILVCHPDDVKLAVEAAREVFAETNNPFYDPGSFSIWFWTVTTARETGRREELRLHLAYGATRNVPLQRMIEEAGGILIPEEVLATLRFSLLIEPLCLQPEDGCSFLFLPLCAVREAFSAPNA